MAEEIKQTLGFDASQALQTLKELDQLLASVGTRLEAQAAAFTAFNGGASATVEQLRLLALNANNAAAAFSKLNSTAVSAPQVAAGGTGAQAPNAQGFNTATQGATQAAAAAQNATAQTNKFVVSLETLSRVVFTQAIVRGMSQIRDAIEQAFDSNLKFVKSLSEIATIGQGADRNISALSSRTRELSDSFNVPLLQVTKGLYETISNNFAGAAESQQVLIASLKFGKAAVVDLDGAVNLLTGTLNAYGKSSEDAEVIAAQFFKTIELGRVTGSELVNSFGPIAPVAREAGVAITELDAAFATITIGGVKANRAATGIQAAITALLKPSDAAKTAFKELGVSSGEQLIAAEGLQGAFKKLIGTTNGEASAIAQLFPNVRALNAVLRLTSEDGAAKFKDVLSQIEGAGKDTLNKAFQIRIDTNAEKVERDLNKIKNFFTVDIGEKLVSSMQRLFGTIPGGVDTILDGIAALAPVAAAATVALGTVGAALLAINTSAALAASGVNALLLSFTGFAAAALAAQAAGDFLGNRLVNTLHNAEKEFDRGQKERIDKAVAANEQRFQTEAETNRKIVQDFNKVGNDIRRKYFERVEDAKQANKLILDDTESILDRIVQAHSKQFQDLKNASSRATQDITKSQERQNDVQAQLDDRRFAAQNARFNTSIQQARLKQQAETLAAKATSDLLNNRTPAGEKNALQEFQRAQKAAEDSLALANQGGNRAAKINAEREVQRILEKQVQAEKDFQNLREQDRKQADKLAAEENSRLEKLKDLRERILKNANEFDKKGEPLSADKRSENLKNVKTDLEEFKRLALQGPKVNLSDLLNVDQFEARISQRLSGTEIKRLNLLPAALDSLSQEIQGSLDAKSFIVKVAPDKTRLQGLDLNEQLAEVGRQFGEQNEIIEEGNKRLIARQRLEEEIRSLQGGANGVLDSQNQSLINFNRNLANAVPELAKVKAEVQQLFADIKNAAANPQAGNADEIALLQRVEAGKAKLAQTPGSKGAAGAALASDFDAAARAVGRLMEAEKKEQQARDLDIGPGTAGQEKLDAAKAKVEELRQALTDPALQSSLNQPATDATTMAAQGTDFKTAMAGTVSAFEADAAASQVIAANMAQAAQSAREVAAANATAAFGGLLGTFNAGGKVNAQQYYAAGGPASVGTDHINAMLAKNEFVVKASQAQKFLPQLQAINAGMQPVFRNEGGAVTNVGDINVNVSGGSTSETTARQIAVALRRELRRGTSTLH